MVCPFLGAGCISPHHAECPLFESGGRGSPLDPEPISPVSGGGRYLHVGNRWFMTRMAT